MKITEGFVAVKLDGTHTYLSVRDTHTGHHVELKDVKTIEDASVFPTPNFRSQRVPAWQQQQFERQVKFVPVEIRREVLLKGYGHD